MVKYSSKEGILPKLSLKSELQELLERASTDHVVDDLEYLVQDDGPIFSTIHNLLNVLTNHSVPLIGPEVSVVDKALAKLEGTRWGIK